VGDQVRIQVTLLAASDGTPITVTGAQVTLYEERSFGSVRGDVEVARAAANEDGVAVLLYEPRTAGERKLAVQYTLPGQPQPAKTTFGISVAEGPQLYRSTAGIRVPGLNVWLIIAVISAVWGILFTAAFLMLRIARAGQRAMPPVAGGSWPTGREEGADRIARLLPYLLVIAVGWMAVVFIVGIFLRSPYTHSNLDPEGYDRTPVANVGQEYAFEGPGLADPQLANTGDPIEDGRVLFFQYGCSSCHGLRGQGGVVGPPINVKGLGVAGLRQLIRRAPGGMPSYTEESLGNEGTDKLYTFLGSVARSSGPTPSPSSTSATRD